MGIIDFNSIKNVARQSEIAIDSCERINNQG